MKIGLRIDADTFRGTEQGVPNLLRVLGEHSITATFFVCVGPDNMGRHLWRLFRPSFLAKMMRTKAASLYGWDILLKGAFWPGPDIGDKLGDVIRAAADAGHEVGLHAWDHYTWQAHIDRMLDAAVHEHLSRGYDMLARIIGRAPTCSAAPGWKCHEETLLEKSRFPFAWNSDCRGESIFYPVVDGNPLTQPQIPVTLPTYDEVVGRDGIEPADFNNHMLSLLKPDRLNVLTIHAESEGIVCRDMFAAFLKAAKARGAEFVPLGSLLPDPATIVQARIEAAEIPGRSGWVACQRTLCGDTAEPQVSLT